MNAAGIDFARRPPLPAWFLPGMALVMVLLAWGGYRYASLQADLADVRTQAATQRQSLARLAATPPPAAPAPARERVKSVNEAIAALNVPWPALLGAVEAARPPDVALTRVEPRPKDRMVLITAQADDMPTLIGFMERLARTAPFVRVLPVRQEIALDAGMQRRQATFEARWEDRP